MPLMRLVLNQFGDLLDQLGLVDLVGDFRDDQSARVLFAHRFRR